MNKLIFIILIFLLLAIKITHQRDRDFKPLLVSLFIISVPLVISFELYKVKSESPSGTLSTVFFLNTPLILYFTSLLFFKRRSISFNYQDNKLELAIILLAIISLINPENQLRGATLVFVYFIFSYFVLFKLIIDNLSANQIFKGIYDGIALLSILQFFLAIMFPLLNIKEVTDIFHNEGGIWSTRDGTRPGAVGIFSHPGNLALYTMMTSTFLLSCYCCGLKKRMSVFFILINTGTLFLTYSRTSYLTYIVAMFTVYFIGSNRRFNLFSLKNLLRFVLPLVLVLVWVVYYSPLSDIFLKSDSNEMFDARLIHWTLGFKLFTLHPLIGVGINSHLEYIAKNMLLFDNGSIPSFFWQNPIHNIHLIILVEQGLLGFLVWIIYVVLNIVNAQRAVNAGKNMLFPLWTIGVVISFFLYGLTGWAPLSPSILPLFLFVIYFSSKLKNKIL
ncbi:O-antigen ligase family protein [Flectobacillus major]|uniref:O-antigen ligase family protein n=1 Tax=Flectobacillus major TaxID=103 RepID=UPI0003F90943|nr:O-antigen ligase family protein [Flectobacillus major]